MKAKKKTAFIIGSGGQDGRILFDYLAGLDYRLIGVTRDKVKTRRIKWSGKIDITKKEQVNRLVKTVQPEEIYYLATFHYSAQDQRDDFYTELEKNYKINIWAFINFLEALRLFSPQTKIFYASSSFVFGNCRNKRQTEKTAYRPDTPYGLSKASGALLCRLYREKHKIFAAAGILYNHESQYRPENFISMKIIKGALNIKRGLQDKLIIGDLKAVVDWGYAPDYVRAMHQILALKRADDFIIATGQAHTVGDFVKISFSYLGLDWRHYVRENKSIIKEKRPVLIGNFQKLKEKTGWQPSVDFSGMIKTIIDKLK